jgi:hypothetical protein
LFFGDAAFGKEPCDEVATMPVAGWFVDRGRVNKRGGLRLAGLVMFEDMFLGAAILC